MQGEDGNNYVINYTLDNYVRIYGNGVAKEGYILDKDDAINIAGSTVTFNGTTIEPEELSENIATYKVGYIKDAEGNLKNYPYKTDATGEKIYYDDAPTEGEPTYFKINNSSYKKIKVEGEYTPDEEPEPIYIQQTNEMTVTNNVPYVYNSSNEKRYYDYNVNRFFAVDKNGERTYLVSDEYQEDLVSGDKYNLKNQTYTVANPPKDYSARNYYKETSDFNNWLNSGSNELKDKGAEILANKTENIISNIQNNLELSLINYSSHSDINYELPILTDEDWERALSNISVIAFFQGIRAGLKVYNNYAVVSSTVNNEYIGEESFYYISNEDTYYHLTNCGNVVGTISQAYLNTDFIAKSYKNSGNKKYYYKHAGTIYDEETKKYNYTTAFRPCFYCIVDRNNSDKSKDDTLYTALARERYIQMGRTKLTN